MNLSLPKHKVYMKQYHRTKIRRRMFAQRGVDQDGAPERNNIFISTRTLKVAALGSTRNYEKLAKDVAALDENINKVP